MGGYGRVFFVLLCTVYILKLASYDNIVMASTISPSGKVDLAVFLTKIEKENVMSFPVRSKPYQFDTCTLCRLGCQQFSTTIEQHLV